MQAVQLSRWRRPCAPVDPGGGTAILLSAFCWSAAPSTLKVLLLKCQLHAQAYDMTILGTV